MPRSTRPEISDHLQRIFQTQPVNPWPRDLLESVQFSFPYLSWTSVFEKNIAPSQAEIGWFFEGGDGANGAVLVNLTPVPAGFFDYWVAGSLVHNDAVARVITLGMLYGGAVVPLAETSSAAVAANYAMALNRGVVLLPGFSPAGVAATMGAGSHLSILALRFRLIPGMDVP